MLVTVRVRTLRSERQCSQKQLTLDTVVKQCRKEEKNNQILHYISDVFLIKKVGPNTDIMYMKYPVKTQDILCFEMIKNGRQTPQASTTTAVYF